MLFCLTGSSIQNWFTKLICFMKLNWTGKWPSEQTMSSPASIFLVGKHSMLHNIILYNIILYSIMLHNTHTSGTVSRDERVFYMHGNHDSSLMIPFLLNQIT